MNDILTITKQPIVEEDLGLENTPVIQFRDEKEVWVTPLKLFKIADNLEQLRVTDFNKFSQGVVFGGEADSVGNNCFYKWFPDNTEVESLPDIVTSKLSETGRWVKQDIGGASSKGDFVTIDTEQTIDANATKTWYNFNKFYGYNEAGQIALIKDDNSQNLKLTFCETDESSISAHIGYTSRISQTLELFNKLDGEIAVNRDIVFSNRDSETIDNVGFIGYTRDNRDNLIISNTKSDKLYIANDIVGTDTYYNPKFSLSSLNGVLKITNQDTGAIEFNSDLTFSGGRKKINYVATPTLAHQATPKDYVDTADQALDTKIQQNAANIETNRQNIAQNTADIETNRQNIAQNTADIETNRQNIAQNTADIETNRQNIAQNSSKIETNRQNIAQNSSKIETNRQNIETNRQNIAQNTQSIQQNSQNITQTNDRIDALDDKVTQMSGSSTIIGQIPKTKDQVEANKTTILNAFVQQVKSRTPLEGDTIFTSDNYAYYYTTSWSQAYTIAINIASTTTAGLVLSTTDVDSNRGKIYVNPTDGVMSVIGQVAYLNVNNTFTGTNSFTGATTSILSTSTSIQGSSLTITSPTIIDNNLTVGNSNRSRNVIVYGNASCSNSLSAGLNLFAGASGYSQTPEDQIFTVCTGSGNPSRLNNKVCYNKDLVQGSVTDYEVVNNKWLQECITGSQSAAPSNMVTLDTAQTITGSKTFNANTYLYGGSNYVRNLYLQSGYTFSAQGNISSSGTNTFSGSNTFNGLTYYSRTPTSNTEVANKKYVDDKVASAGGGSSGNYVTLDTAQTITGSKTFTTNTYLYGNTTIGDSTSDSHSINGTACFTGGFTYFAHIASTSANNTPFSYMTRGLNSATIVTYGKSGGTLIATGCYAYNFTPSSSTATTGCAYLMWSYLGSPTTYMYFISQTGIRFNTAVTIQNASFGRATFALDPEWEQDYATANYVNQKLQQLYDHIDARLKVLEQAVSVPTTLADTRVVRAMIDNMSVPKSKITTLYEELDSLEGYEGLIGMSSPEERKQIFSTNDRAEQLRILEEIKARKEEDERQNAEQQQKSV